MRVQWRISDESVAWARQAARLGGLDAGPFVDNLIRFHAGGLSDNELCVFENHLALAEDVVLWPGEPE